jgi:type IV pilus assembly protein PilB
MSGGKKLGEILLEQKLITQEQLALALEKQKENPSPLGETLIRMGFLTENAMMKAVAKHLSVDYLGISENDYEFVDRSLAGIFSMETCQRLGVLPVFFVENGGDKQLTVAMSDPLDVEAIHEMERHTSAHIIPVLTNASAISGGITKLFEVPTGVPIPGAGPLVGVFDETIKYVNRLLAQAVQMGASDIHIEPHAKEVHVRLRVDGVLRVVDSFALSDLPRMVIRIKNMGSEKQSVMRMDERRVPQDGSFARVVGGHGVDFRVSTFPTLYGEKVALRVLDKDKMESIQGIGDLKMPPSMEKQFVRCVKQNSGIIIATGPTGSGKTTTLHAAVNHINSVGLNIVTIEDPVEYHSADYVNQSSVKRQAGYTYPVAMRSIMRQDPDVILIGEIRDLETAQIAVQAALTGHLVFTTLHTDDAAGAVVRLVDLGIEEFLVSSTVVSAVNQRLLRKICPQCKESYVPSMEELDELGIESDLAADIIANSGKYRIIKGRGCKSCLHTGYSGRQATFELLSVTPAIKKLILQKETSDVIADKARAIQDINMIFEDGLRLVLKGLTTFDELWRVPRGSYRLKPIDKIFQTAGDASFQTMS